MAHDLIRSVFQGRSGLKASQLALDHVLLGAAEGKYLVQRLRETLELLLRMVGQYEVVDDIDQALHLHVCP